MDSSDSMSNLHACFIRISAMNLEKGLLFLMLKYRLNEVGVMCKRSAKMCIRDRDYTL